MKKLNVLIALTTNDNDYQLEQAQAAEEAARRLGISIQIIHADNDAINQSQQILKIIQSSTNSRPDAVVFEPVGATALPHIQYLVLPSAQITRKSAESKGASLARSFPRAAPFYIFKDHLKALRLDNGQPGCTKPSA